MHIEDYPIYSRCPSCKKLSVKSIASTIDRICMECGYMDNPGANNSQKSRGMRLNFSGFKSLGDWRIAQMENTQEKAQWYGANVITSSYSLPYQYVGHLPPDADAVTAEKIKQWYAANVHNHTPTAKKPAVPAVPIVELGGRRKIEIVEEPGE
jgi:hypothetical protein